MCDFKLKGKRGGWCLITGFSPQLLSFTSQSKFPLFLFSILCTRQFLIFGKQLFLFSIYERLFFLLGVKIESAICMYDNRRYIFDCQCKKNMEF